MIGYYSRTGEAAPTTPDVLHDEQIPAATADITHFRQPVRSELPLRSQVKLMKHLILDVWINANEV